MSRKIIKIDIRKPANKFIAGEDSKLRKNWKSFCIVLHEYFLELLTNSDEFFDLYDNMFGKKYSH